jgi:hypothetical protein
MVIVKMDLLNSLSLWIQNIPPNTLQFWGVIGTWVAGIGTLSAVIVSLWLAYNNSKIKLKITAGHRLLLKSILNSPSEYCLIKVVNAGDRAVNITGVGWETGRFKNKKSILQFFGIDESDKVPKVLLGGHEANFMVPFRLKGNDEDWIVRFPKELTGVDNNTNYIRKLKVVVVTSIGKTFKTRVEASLIKKLLESYETKRTNLPD